MGGVDALDALIAYYRIHIRSKKYYHRLFFHFVDMVIVNSWLLYRRDCESLTVPKKKQKDLLAFRTSIAQALCMQGKDLSKKKRGRPSLDVEREFEKKKHRGPATVMPTQEVRSDAVGHWPVVESERQRCKLPHCKGQTVIKCAKCTVHLCLNKNKDCLLVNSTSKTVSCKDTSSDMVTIHMTQFHMTDEKFSNCLYPENFEI